MSSLFGAAWVDMAFRDPAGDLLILELEPRWPCHFVSHSRYIPCKLQANRKIQKRKKMKHKNIYRENNMDKQKHH